jgi:serine/threonine protein kinase
VKGHLGSGQFGSVQQGVWKNGSEIIPVALKVLKEEASETDKVKFLQEAAIMAQFTHPNVISLYGVVSKGEPVSKFLHLEITLIKCNNYYVC